MRVKLTKDNLPAFKNNCSGCGKTTVSKIEDILATGNMGRLQNMTKEECDVEVA